MNLLQKNRRTREEVLAIAKESNKRSQIMASMVINTSKKGNLLDRINVVVATIEREFRTTKDLYELILEEDLLAHYIDISNNNGILILDTETSSVDPISCIMAGASFYTLELKPAYCPINHVSYASGNRIEKQLNAEIIIKHLNRLDDDVKLIFHNAKFDLRVLRNQLKLDMFRHLWWDTMIASCLLDENESHSLKDLYSKYCDGESIKYSDLFNGIPFHFIPIKTGYLYAAKDAKMTYDLFKFQEPFLTADNPLCQSKGLEKIALYYQDIELPVIDSLCEMEDAGCEIDIKHLENLSEKLHKDLIIKEKEFRKVCEPFDVDIKKYRLQSIDKCKLDDPILISSPQQISILLYDIIECESVDKRKPKSTEAPILIKLKNKYKDDKDFLNLINTLIDYRHIEKLLSTYVDSIPTLINPVSGKLHTHFNQHVARTGRLSSSDPNFQNLPKRSEVGKEVRKAFRGKDDEVLIFGDYCFSNDTEILTDKGWKLFKDLDKTELIAQWKDGLITFDKPMDYQEFDYSGIMKRISGSFVDMLVSPNHNCLVVDESCTMKFVKPENFPKKGNRQVVSGMLLGGEFINYLELMLMVAIQADAQVRTNTIRFFLKNEKKIERLSNYLNSLNIPHAVNKVSSKSDFKIFNFFKKDLSDIFRKYLIDYKDFSENLLLLAPTQREFLLLELRQWNDKKYYCSEIKNNVDIISRLAVLTGYRCTYIEKLYLNKKPLYNVTFSKHDLAWVDRFKREDVNYTGKIYCVSMPYKTVVVKRNGKIFITGQSQQEPRILAYVTSDKEMLRAYKEGKDLYAHGGSFVFKVDYIECLEEYPDGTFNPEGEKRRIKIKSIILGIMYEKQSVSIAEDLGITVKEAQALQNMFFETFPMIKIYRDQLMEFVKEHGFVNMINGMRKARIPDMTLPKYEITRISEGNDFDPLDGIDSINSDDLSSVFNMDLPVLEIDDETYTEYYTAMEKAYGYQKKRAVIDRAAEDGIKIVDNSYKIQEATRQVVNSVIQGSAAIITKNACVKLNTERVRQLKGRRLDFYKQLEPYIVRSKWLKDNNIVLAIQVHDELIHRSKLSVAKKAKKIIEDIMIESAEDLITVPMKVDCKISQKWFGKRAEL